MAARKEASFTLGACEAADLADELQGSGADLAVGNGRIEIEEKFYVAAHEATSDRYCKGLLDRR
jgi:hypothetical protein